jgi:hypothetical protein
VYSVTENEETRTSHVKIDESGKGSVEIHNEYKGLKYNKILPTFLADDADKKRQISELMKFPSFQILNFKYKENKAIIPSIEETLNVEFENYLSLMGSRYLLQLNFSNSIEGFPYNLRSRKTDVYIRRSSIEIDTIVYELPSTLKPESLPKLVSIKTKFGDYLAKVEFTNNQLFYIRSFQLNKGRYPASDYDSFVDLFDKVSSADGMRCALIKN